MNAISLPFGRRDSEKGAVLVLVAILIVVLLGFVGLAVDLGYFFVTRNELQNVADGSALAGARTLGAIYQDLTYEEQQGFTCSDGSQCADSIRGMAEDVAAENRAAGRSVDLPDFDVLIGDWDGETFTVTDLMPDAVQVFSRRDDVANGPVSTFFARVLGIESRSVTAIAVAALTGQGTTDEGEVELPIGISRWFFDSQEGQAFCNEDIQFYPTNDPASCAGWTSWEFGSNDVTLRHILDEDPGYVGPQTIAYESVFNFTGGTLSEPTFDALLSLFQEKGYDVDAQWNYLLDGGGNRVHAATLGVTYQAYDLETETYYSTQAVPLWELDSDGNPVIEDGSQVQLEYPDGTPRNWHKWETTVPVYDRDDCSNPNQSIRIVGFAEIELTDVLDAPDKLVRGRVKCNLVSPEPNRGGGGEYGVRGSIPGLVK